MEQYLKDRAALEAKYHDLCKPLYSERAAIIKGENDEEIGESKEGDIADDQAETVDKDEDEKVDESQANDKNDENKVIGIPQFWICAMTHMEPLAELIAEDDVDALEYL
jgi:nucleosome assembly protein 1-like 1